MPTQPGETLAAGPVTRKGCSQMRRAGAGLMAGEQPTGRDEHRSPSNRPGPTSRCARTPRCGAAQGTAAGAQAGGHAQNLPGRMRP